MTKQQELDALRRFTESIPHDSYLRPWLEEIMPQIEADIRNDFPVAPTIEGARQRCSTMIGEANSQVVDILARASQQAKDIEAEARTEADSIRGRIAEVIRSCERAVCR